MHYEYTSRFLLFYHLSWVPLEMAGNMDIWRIYVFNSYCWQKSCFKHVGWRMSMADQSSDRLEARGKYKSKLW